MANPTRLLTGSGPASTAITVAAWPHPLSRSITYSSTFGAIVSATAAAGPPPAPLRPRDSYSSSEAYLLRAPEQV